MGIARLNYLMHLLGFFRLPMAADLSFFLRQFNKSHVAFARPPGNSACNATTLIYLLLHLLVLCTACGQAPDSLWPLMLPAVLQASR